MQPMHHVFASPWGALYLVATPSHLTGISWRPPAGVQGRQLEAGGPAAAILRATMAQLGDYARGTRQTFDLPLLAAGTPFQQRVWRALAALPFGVTCSYRALAAAVGAPGAVRAVGSANGKNPLSIVVPCHRVIAADGTLGGYAGGLAVKGQLLRLEGHVPSAPVSRVTRLPAA